VEFTDSLYTILPHVMSAEKEPTNKKYMDHEEVGNTTSSEADTTSILPHIPKSNDNTGRQYYSVRIGRDVKKCIFLSWEDCVEQVQGVYGADYSSFRDLYSAASSIDNTQINSCDENLDTISRPYYVVRKGRDVNNCIFLTREDCMNQVEGVDGAGYSSFRDIFSAVSSIRVATTSHTRALQGYADTTERLYYGVRKGLSVNSCIFLTWKDCADQVEGVDSVEYSTFPDLYSAVEFTTPKYMKGAAVPLPGSNNSSCSTPIATIKPKLNQRQTSPLSSKSSALALVDGDIEQNNNMIKKETQSCSGEKKLLMTKSITLIEKEKKRKFPGTEVDISNVTSNADARPHKKQPQSEKVQKETPSNFSKEIVGRQKAALPKNWIERYERLKLYFEIHGTCEITKTEDDPSIASLRRFIKAQQAMYRTFIEKGKYSDPISAQKIKLLQDINFAFESCAPKVLSRHWMAKYNKLVKYYGERGTFDMSNNPSFRSLNRFAKNQREMYRSFQEIVCKVDENDPDPIVYQKIKLLQDINFDFDTKEATRSERLWEINFEKLRKYKEVNGDCDIKKRHELYGWVHRQRGQYKILREGGVSLLTAKGMQRLVDIGFVFNNRPPYVTWEERMEQLQEYKETHGHIMVPKSHPILGPFVQKQRSQYALYEKGKKCHMTEDRMKQLDVMGFVFLAGPRLPERDPSKNKSWDERFTEMLEYKETYGHTKIPQKYKDSPTLGQWVHMQRKEYKKMRKGLPSYMTPEKALRLSEAEFVFDVINEKKDKSED